MTTSLSTRRYIITGSPRPSNYLWALLVSLGGIGFLFTGFASFLGRGLFIFNQSTNIAFLPQGLIMCFYGSLGLVFGAYLWCTIFWKVGNGFNEFNKQQGNIRIFRWGLPGKDRRINLIYQIEQVEGVSVMLKEGISPRRTISLRFKGKGDIPLTRIGQPISLEDIETEASELAQFLQVSLDTFYEI